MRISSQPNPGLGKRRAVAGLIVGILVFGLIFTVGTGFFLYENQLSHASSQAALNREASNIQEGQERLGLAAYSETGQYPIYIEASNNGGVPSIITAVYVTNINAKMLSQYLVSTSSGLSINLPISLGVGYNTDSISGCGTTIGCDIGISSSAFAYNPADGNVYLNLLTSSGNVFSVVYPPPTLSTTTETIGVSTTTLTTGSTITSTLPSTSTTILTSSSTSGEGLNAGTNSLEVSLEACPGALPGTTFTNTCSTSGATTVYSSGEVVLIATVTNLSPVSMNVLVSFQSVATNGATMTSSSPAYPASCSPTAGPTATISGSTNTVTIPAGNTASYDCTFSAGTGSQNTGTVTFTGFAVGTFTIGAAPPVTITSAESTSNTLQLGNPLTNIAGPWLVNYFSFDYASQESPSWQSATTISAGGNKQVTFQVQVTNTASSSLTILGYSYILVGRLSQEMDYYLVAGTTYSTTLSSFTCTNTGTGGAPSGSGCITVGIGFSQTLDFAACSPQGSSFMWQTTGGGNSACSGNNTPWSAPEGVVMFVVIVYEYQSGGNWVTFSQSIPAQGIYISA